MAGSPRQAELGNLPGPLNFFQVAGIWPSLDFRFDPHLKPAVIALAALCLAIAAITVAVAARRGERDGVPLAGYAGGGALGALAIAYFGGPWMDAKAMASLSPALLGAALIGIAMLGQRSRFRLEAAVLGDARRRGSRLVGLPRLPGRLVRAALPLHRAGEDR